MECNKDEAMRSKEIAEKKMHCGDFEAAWKFALKAEQLYQGLDNVSQLLTVCEVHCAAQKTVNGAEKDWYGILQVEAKADETVIKKQYKKLALSLHPDKNKFAGAEAAFKLICDANRVLSDPLKRSAYDAKCRSSMRPTVAPPKGAHSNQLNKNSHAAKNTPHPKNSQSSQKQPLGHTFWTTCFSCKTWYQYYRVVQNKTICCQSCQKNFVALDLGVNGGPPVANQSQCQRQSTVHQQSNAAEPSSAFPHPAQKAGKTADVSGSYIPNESKAGNAADFGGHSKQEKKANGGVDLGTRKGASMTKESGVSNAASRKRERQSVDESIKSTSSGRNGSAVPDTTKLKESELPNSGSRKRERKSADESSKSFGTGSNDSDVHVKADVFKPHQKRERKSVDKSSNFRVVQENGDSVSARSSDQPRRSSRQKQDVVYKVDLSGGGDGDNDDDDCVSPPKKAKGSNSSNAAKDMEATSVGVGVSKEKSSATDEMSTSKKSKAGDSNVNKDEASMSKKSGAQYEGNYAKTQVDESILHSSEPPNSQATLEFPEAEFNNFDKHKVESCFAVNQVWAIYDPADGMPRFYARVKKVYSSLEFKLQIRWLEASPDDKDEQNWCDKELPVACGRFENGDTQETDDREMFSHQIICSQGKCRGTYFVYPKKGETWAIFKDWNMKWSSEPQKHRPPYQFDFVVIDSDYIEPVGVRVLYLKKVGGFVSVFQPADCNGVITFSIPSSELYRFSHQIPSFKLAGDEAVGIPSGSYELDPASLPSDCFCDLELNIDQKMRGSEQTGIPSKNGKIEPSIESKKTCTPSKHERDPGKGSPILRRSPRVIKETCKSYDQNNASQSTKAGVHDSCQTDERIESPVKQHKSELPQVACHLPRRSPRDIGKKYCQVNGGAASNQSDDTVNFPTGNGRSSGSIKSPMSSGCKVIEMERHNFDIEKSEDKFQVGQIWATYSNKDGLPTSYVQVKKIESTPNFILHVVMLEPCLQGRNLKSSSCGVFKIKSHKTTALPPTKFSHQLEAELVGKNVYEIHPKTGEVWALCKNWNPGGEFLGSSEFDFVEIEEDNDQGVTVVVLIPFKGAKTLYRVPVSRRVKTSLMQIPCTEFGRFSHQCSAFVHTEEVEGRMRRFWELEKESVPDKCIVLD